MGLFNETKHPRDLAGKFAEAKSVAADHQAQAANFIKTHGAAASGGHTVAVGAHAITPAELAASKEAARIQHHGGLRSLQVIG